MSRDVTGYDNKRMFCFQQMLQNMEIPSPLHQTIAWFMRSHYPDGKMPEDRIGISGLLNPCNPVMLNDPAGIFSKNATCRYAFHVLEKGTICVPCVVVYDTIRQLYQRGFYPVIPVAVLADGKRG